MVCADEPTIRPTHAPERSPWGDRASPRYHVEIAPLGARQVAGVVLAIPGRTGVRVDGSVLLEQDGRSVRFSLPVAAVDPAFPPHPWHDGALVDPPFDLRRPIALRFEPTERSAARDPEHGDLSHLADPHDFWWAEPFEIELRPDSPVRRTRPGGRVIWFGGAERDPPR